MRTIKYQAWDGHIQNLVEKESKLVFGGWLRSRKYEFNHEGSQWLEILVEDKGVGHPESIYHNYATNLKKVDLSKGIFYPTETIGHASAKEWIKTKFFYEPNNEAELYQAFLKVNINKPTSIIKFIERFGILGFTNPLSGSGIEPFDYFQRQWNNFKHLFDFYFHLKEKNITELKGILKSELGKCFPTSLTETQLEILAYQWFWVGLNKHLNKINPMIYWAQGELPDELLKDKNFQLLDPRFLGGYSCPRLIDSIYLQFFLDMTNPEGILKKCKFCGRPFIAGSYNPSGGRKPRTDREVCTVNCGSAFRQATLKANRKLNYQKKPDQKKE